MLAWLVSILGDIGTVIESVGPFRELVTTVLAIVAAGIVLFTLIFRGLNLSPPLEGLGRTIAASLAMIAAMLGVVAIYLYHERDPIGTDLTPAALVACLVAFVVAIVYFTCSYFLTFKDLNDERHIKGLWLDHWSVKVLNGERDGLPEERLTTGPPPSSPEDYFNGSGRSEPWVWTRLSLFLSAALLVALYFAMSAGLVGGLSALAIEVAQVEDRIDVGASVLFDVDRAELRPEALHVLEAEFKRIEAFHARRVHVVGHTDETSTVEHNEKLSQARAEAVRAWIIARSRGQGMVVSAEGRGEREPLVAEDGLSGTALAEARSVNRRVSIHLSR